MVAFGFHVLVFVYVSGKLPTYTSTFFFCFCFSRFKWYFPMDEVCLRIPSQFSTLTLLPGQMFSHNIIVGHWLDMVYPPPPRGHFVDHIFLEAQCLARILQHVSPLTMAALSCNSLLHTLPYKIFDN